MRIGRLIGGIICLLAAVLLAILIFALPEGKVVFIMDEANMPWVPVIALAALGLGQLATSVRVRIR
jgi:hypothetical protein